MSRLYSADHEGDYRFALDLAVDGAFTFDPGRCTVVSQARRSRAPARNVRLARLQVVSLFCTSNTYPPATIRLTFEVEPLTPPEKRLTSLDFRIVSLKVQGPLDPKYWTRPKNYERFFPKDEPPQTDPERREYAREILGRFATKAFRRPVDDRTLDRLVAIAEGIYRQPGHRFEQGVARAMVAVLASPRFVFRVEANEPKASPTATKHPYVDEYSLASRLSYFLWSTMPDDELTRLAERGELRKDLARQVKRMREDARSESLTQNFVGQWLQVRDVEGFTINIRAVLRQDGGSRQRIDPRYRAAAGDAPRDRDALRPHRARRSQPARVDRQRLHLRQRQARAALRDQGRDRQRDAQSVASQGQPPRRRADSCFDLAGDFQPDSNLAGEAGPVYPR